MTSVSLAFKPPLATITFDNDKQLNAFSNEDYDAFADALEAIEKRKDIYITVWQADGRFFSSGANVHKRKILEVQRPSKSPRRQELAKIITLTDLSRQLWSHTKILVAILNGPALGIAAALLGHCDFIYSGPNTWIAVPFHSIGIASEGNSSSTFMDKMGHGKANEVLLWGKKTHVIELEKTGFVNKIFPPSLELPSNASPVELSTDLQAQVHSYLVDIIEPLDGDAILLTKSLIKRSVQERNDPEAVSAREANANVGRAVSGIPNERFRQLASGERRHKL